MAIFHNTESRDRTDKNLAFCFEGFVVKQQSDVKNDFIYEIIHLEVFFKKIAGLTIYNVLDNLTKGRSI